MGEGILFSYFCHGGISRVGRSIRVRVVERSDLDSVGAVRVCGFVGGTTVGTTDRWLCAGWAFLACQDGA